MENNMELPQETKNINRTTILHRNSMSCHILKEKKALIQKDMHPYIHGSTTYNSQDMEST